MFAWFGEGKDLIEKHRPALIAYGNSHPIGVYVKANNRHNWTIDLLLFLMGNIQFVPKQQQFHLIGRKVTAVRCIVQHTSSGPKGTVVVDIYLEVGDVFDILSNPCE